MQSTTTRRSPYLGAGSESASYDLVISRRPFPFGFRSAALEHIRAGNLTPLALYRFRSEEIETTEMTPDELTAFIESEIARWTPIAKKASAN